MTDAFVPIIDIGEWTSGDAGSRARIAAEVDAALREVGFMQIVGHGVPDDVIQAMLDAADGFFTRPLDEKLPYVAHNPELNRGYAAHGTESLSYSLGVDAPPDLFEAFTMGPDDVPDTPVYAAERHRIFAPNLWPGAPEQFREQAMAYFDHVAALARRLTSIFAVALDLEPDFFADKTDHSTDTLRMIRYERPPGSPDPLPGQMRIGAHTDYGIVTVLYGDQVPGLQLLGKDGAYHDVMPVDGAYVINIGDLLAEWTNDRWRSTLHRVVPPPAGVDGPVLRRSTAFFHDGNYDALVECLPTCCSEENPPKYAPVLAGEHLMAKLVAPRTRDADLPSGTTDTLGDRAGAVGR